MDDLEQNEPADGDDSIELPAEGGKRVKASSLLWFISSRPYVPMADVRRRFNLYTDIGALLWDEEGPVHIGLPRQAAETLLDLKRKRRVDLEYNLEHAMRIAVGVYPLRIRLAPPLPARVPVFPPAARVAPPPSPAVFPDDQDVRVEVEELETVVVLERATELGGAPTEATAAAASSRRRRRRRRR